MARRLWWTAVILVLLGMVGAFSRYYIPGTGFTYVLDIGDSRYGLRRLPEFATLPYYRQLGVPGYDGQFYAQLALRPSARDPELIKVIDNPPYRARRAMMAWVAWAVGLGRPTWVLNVFACLNLLSWLALGVLLWRWFTPGDPWGLAVWSAVMLSAGLLSSMRHALTDGPALLALTATMALLESGRRWPAVVAAAVSGLTRETTLLVGLAFAPATLRPQRAWLKAAGLVALATAPLALWMWHLRGLWQASAFEGSGVDNITWPFTGYVGRWQEIFQAFAQRGFGEIQIGNFLIHVGVTVQAIWIVVRPRWKSLWWRIGAVHVVLLAVIDTQVWEGYPGASARVLLPLLLAFNLTLPRGRAGLVLLVMGNLGLYAGLLEMRPPARAAWSVHGPMEIVRDAATGRRFTVEYLDGFYSPESYQEHAWRWTSGQAWLRLANPQPFVVRARMEFGLRAVSARRVVLRVAEEQVWSGRVGPDLQEVEVPELLIPPGGLVLVFEAGRPEAPDESDTRELAVAVYDVRITLSAVAP